jgi:hypothetical protein
MLRRVGSVALATVVVSGAVAQICRRAIKVVGLNSRRRYRIHDELPFWRKTYRGVEVRQYGDVTPWIRWASTHKTSWAPEVGIMDFAAMDTPRWPATIPLEAAISRGYTLEIDKAPRGLQRLPRRHRPPDAEDWNAKLLAIGGNTPQVFWCRA